MSEQNESGLNPAVAATGDAQTRAQQPKVNWDDSDMASTYANVANVMGTREEMMLLFGNNQTWQGGMNEVTIKLSNRIVMTPHAAKRFYVLLQMGLKQYEDRFGEIKI